MKALESDTVVGTALEDFDGEYAYSEGFVIQFGDNIAEPDTTPDSVTTDKRVNDGCYFGGGTELGEKKCKPRNVARFATIQTQTLDESAPMREALLELAEEEPLEAETPDGKEVKIGQALMFVGLGWHQNVHETTVLAELVSTSTDLVLDGDGEETLWSRIKTLAQGFVDGVLSVAGINTRELCVSDDSGSTCIDRQELNALLQNSQNTNNNNGVEENDEDNDDQEPDTDPQPEPTPEPTPEPEPEPIPEPDPVVEEPDTEEPIVEAEPEGDPVEEPAV
jgi:hypothetical protein